MPYGRSARKGGAHPAVETVSMWMIRLKCAPSPGEMLERAGMWSCELMTPAEALNIVAHHSGPIHCCCGRPHPGDERHRAR